MKTREDIERILLLNGFHLVRDKKHIVWKNTALRLGWVLPKTPSCSRAYDNNWSDLKHKFRELGKTMILDEHERKPNKEKQVSEFKNTPRQVPLEVQPEKKRLQMDDVALQLVRKWKAERRTQKEVVVELDKLGYIAPSGAPMNTTFISNYMVANGMRSKALKKSKGLAVLPPQPSLAIDNKSNFLHDITDLLSSNLSESTKENLVRMLAKEQAK